MEVVGSVSPCFGGLFSNVAIWSEAKYGSITLKMIPQEMLHTKPIDLRHICLFYLGHMCVSNHLMRQRTKEVADLVALHSSTFTSPG